MLAQQLLLPTEPSTQTLLFLIDFLLAVLRLEPRALGMLASSASQAGATQHCLPYLSFWGPLFPDIRCVTGVVLGSLSLLCDSHPVWVGGTPSLALGVRLSGTKHPLPDSYNRPRARQLTYTNAFNQLLQHSRAKTRQGEHNGNFYDPMDLDADRFYSPKG